MELIGFLKEALSILKDLNDQGRTFFLRSELFVDNFARI